MFLHTPSHTPEDARLLLSSAFTAVQAVKPASPIPTVAPDNTPKIEDDLLSQLERLSALLVAGHLTAEEFSLAKASLLGRQPI